MKLNIANQPKIDSFNFIMKWALIVNPCSKKLFCSNWKGYTVKASLFGIPWGMLKGCRVGVFCFYKHLRCVKLNFTFIPFSWKYWGIEECRQKGCTTLNTSIQSDIFPALFGITPHPYGFPNCHHINASAL